MSKLYAVTLNAEGGPSVVLCENVVPDPIFPGNVVLAGITDISWPMSDRFLVLGQWSVKRSDVQGWRQGPVRHDPDEIDPKVFDRESPPSSLFAVMLKLDGGGSGLVLCEKVSKDPGFEGQVVLGGVVGLSLPVGERTMLVDQWAVPAESVLSWMVGPLRASPDLNLEALVNGEKVLPWPKGSTPSQLLVSHAEALGPATATEPDASPEPAKKRRRAPVKKPVK